ncbi:MAG: hypothetical protein ACK5MZ_11205 [Aestuariibaculum sp.]
MYGKQYNQKYIYFEKFIDNELMFDKWSHVNDTIYLARVEKYDSIGRLVKLVKTQNFFGHLKRERIVDVYKYLKNNQLKTWRKELYSNEYNLDTIKNLKTKEFISTNDNWNRYKEEYKYKFDDYGNWIVKESNGSTHEIYYRKIKY